MRPFFVQLKYISKQYFVQPVPVSSKKLLQVCRNADKSYSLFYKTFEVSKVFVQSPNDEDCWYSFPYDLLCKRLVKEKCAKLVKRPPAPDPDFLHKRIDL